MNAKQKRNITCDDLGIPILTFEEKEFMEDRGYHVTLTPPDFYHQIAAPLPSNKVYGVRTQGIRQYGKARFELNLLLASWGGDAYWRNRI